MLVIGGGVERGRGGIGAEDELRLDVSDRAMK